MDVGVLETAGEVATAALVLLLVDVDGGTAGLGCDAEGEGEEVAMVVNCILVVFWVGKLNPQVLKWSERREELLWFLVLLDDEFDSG